MARALMLASFYKLADQDTEQGEAIRTSVVTLVEQSPSRSNATTVAWEDTWFGKQVVAENLSVGGEGINLTASISKGKDVRTSKEDSPLEGFGSIFSSIFNGEEPWSPGSGASASEKKKRLNKWLMEEGQRPLETSLTGVQLQGIQCTLASLQKAIDAQHQEVQTLKTLIKERETTATVTIVTNGSPPPGNVGKEERKATLFLDHDEVLMSPVPASFPSPPRIYNHFLLSLTSTY